MMSFINAHENAPLKSVRSEERGLINARNRIKWVENRPLWGDFRPFLIA